jgi:hypothetical protein
VKKKPKYINPINPYTGQVSALAIMENIGNGFKTFPKAMGDVKRKLECKLRS